MNTKNTEVPFGGIEETSGMLSKFGFGDNTETITIHFSVLYDNGCKLLLSSGMNFQCAREMNFRAQKGEALYHDWNSWSKQEWGTRIEDFLHKTTDSRYITGSTWYCERSISEFNISGVSLGFRTICDEYVELIWRRYGGFESIHVTKRNEVSPDASITLDDLNVEKSEDILELIRLLPGHETSEFVRFD